MKIKSLYFENSEGDWRKIAECPRNEVMKHINAFVEESNKYKKEQYKFKIYYVRTWTDGGFEHYDVGSHTEFFHWGNKKEE